MRLGKNQKTMFVEELAKEIIKGKTFTPAWFTTEKRNMESWEGQSLFALDFDGGITFEEVLKRCQKYGIMPAFAYSTLSSVDNNKFRVIFQTPSEVTDVKVATFVQFSLMEVFPEADGKCKDLCHMYYGGKKLIHEDYSSEVTIAELDSAVCRFIRDKSPTNAARNMVGFCRKVGVDVIKGQPNIIRSPLASVKILWHCIYKCYSYGCSLFKTLNGDGDKEVVIKFNEKATAEKFRAKKRSKITVDNEKVERKVVEHIDFTKLEKECAFYRDFHDGKYIPDHTQRVGIAMNLLAAKGGRKRLIEGLEKCPNFDESTSYYQINQINRNNYDPERCRKFCPPKYYDKCNNPGCMLDKVRFPRGAILEVEIRKTRSLADAEKDLAEAFSNALNSQDTNVYVIKAPTGIGKTELYLPLPNVTIAVPTHNLKDDVSGRMTTAGIPHLCSPKLPANLPAELEQKIESLYAKGAIQATGKELKKNAMGNNAIAEYIAQSRAIEGGNQTLITTHERLLYHQDNNDTVIIDEDPLSTLLKQDTVKISDITALASSLKNIHDSQLLVDFVAKIKAASQEKDYDTPRFPFANPEEIDNAVARSAIISSNVIGFLSSDHYVVLPGGNEIAYITNRAALLPQKKIIIFSATANESMYRKIFGDRLRFTDIGNVETKGRIIQYHEYSFSRYQMENNPKFLELAKQIVGDKPVITFKELGVSRNLCKLKIGAK